MPFVPLLVTIRLSAIVYTYSSYLILSFSPFYVFQLLLQITQMLYSITGPHWLKQINTSCKGINPKFFLLVQRSYFVFWHLMFAIQWKRTSFEKFGIISGKTYNQITGRSRYGSVSVHLSYISASLYINKAITTQFFFNYQR